MKTTLRILSAPFVLVTLLLFHIYMAVKRTYEFIVYGGEMTIYEKDETKTIHDIYELIKKQK